MLYNPEWEVQTSPDIFSLENLIAWLEKQPAGAAYEFQNCEGKCLLGQYMANNGVKWSWSAYCKFRDAFSEPSKDYGSLFNIGAMTPHTFGAALARARAAV